MDRRRNVFILGAISLPGNSCFSFTFGTRLDKSDHYVSDQSQIGIPKGTIGLLKLPDLKLSNQSPTGNY